VRSDDDHDYDDHHDSVDVDRHDHDDIVDDHDYGGDSRQQRQRARPQEALGRHAA
jgi:hypothetical protein